MNTSLPSRQAYKNIKAKKDSHKKSGSSCRGNHQIRYPHFCPLPQPCSFCRFCPSYPVLSRSFSIEAFKKNYPFIKGKTVQFPVRQPVPLLLISQAVKFRAAENRGKRKSQKKPWPHPTPLTPNRTAITGLAFCCTYFGIQQAIGRLFF